MTDPLQSLWAAQDADAQPPSADALRRRARRLHRRVWLRDSLEYAAAAVVVAVFAWYAQRSPNGVYTAGCVAIIAGALTVAAGLWRRRARRTPGAEATADHLRSELVRQRDLLASVPRWYLAPMVPGLLLFNAGVWLARVSQSPARANLGAAVALALLAGATAGIWWLNKAAARRLDADIISLDRSTRS